MKCVFEKGAHLCVYVLNLTCFEQEKNPALILGSLNRRKSERKKTTKKSFDQIRTFMCLRA